MVDEGGEEREKQHDKRDRESENSRGEDERRKLREGEKKYG
jgi:hypothetical protein